MKAVPLGDLEFAIMKLVWEWGRPVTVPEVHRHLSSSRTLAYTTTMTVMSRLVEKGLLTRSEERRPYVYRPALDREDYSAELMLRVLAEVGDRQATLARFVERMGPGDAEVLGDLARRSRRR
ncbi:MAG: BlaI/MecI/CopY family transcriptional regulator [Actinomycetota bacterium]